MIKLPFIDKNRYSTFLITLILLVMGLSASAESKSESKRVLFIGNSYTKQIQKSLTSALAASPYKESHFEFITKGSATLTDHLVGGAAIKKIESGNWDIVVLQEQSQTPAIGGSAEASFYNAVEKFAKEIKDAGGKTMLYMTWGRRDGDKMNMNLFPDYKKMQKELTKAYKKAARKSRAEIAPVGEVWSEVRKKDEALGNALYRKDGSHPSEKGAFLATCVFFRSIFGDSLESIKSARSLNENQTKIIKDAVLDKVKAPKK